MNTVGTVPDIEIMFYNSSVNVLHFCVLICLL